MSKFGKDSIKSAMSDHTLVVHANSVRRIELCFASDSISIAFSATSDGRDGSIHTNLADFVIASISNIDVA
jgi:hypothetical protein